MRLLKSFLPFLDRKKENFLVIEILPGKKRIALIEADFENKAMHLAKLAEAESQTIGDLRKLLKKFGNPAKQKILVLLDSKLATTIYSAVSLVRDNPKDAIDDADLDNLISQAVWKFFDRQRAKVAAKMNVNDFDLLLTDVRIGNIKLDGHRVINPIGFKARTAEIQLGQTFTTRQIINELKEILPMASVQFISEAGVVWSHVINHAQEEKKFVFANIFSGETQMFFSDGFRISHGASKEWGEKNLVACVGDRLQIKPEVSRAIIAKYNQGDASPAVIKKIENFLLEELESLAAGLNPVISDLGARDVYLNFFFDAPPAVFSGSFKNKFGRSLNIAGVIHDLISDNYHFQLKYRKEAYKKTAFPLFASVIETTFLPHYEKMSQMAKKRLRWLSPS